jgi:hypothetical protein
MESRRSVFKRLAYHPVRVILVGLLLAVLGFVIRDLVSRPGGVALIAAATIIIIAAPGLVMGPNLVPPPSVLSDDPESDAALELWSNEAMEIFPTGLIYAVLIFIIPFVMIALATNGDIKAIGGFLQEIHGQDLSISIASFACYLCEDAIGVFLVFAPQLLRWRLPWERASEQVRTALSAWLAALAAVSTWLYIFLLHFENGPLATISRTPLAVAALAAATLLAPTYSFIVRLFWKRGSMAVINPAFWRSAWLAARPEIKRVLAPPPPPPPPPPVDSTHAHTTGSANQNVGESEPTGPNRTDLDPIIVEQIRLMRLASSLSSRFRVDVPRTRPR